MHAILPLRRSATIIAGTFAIPVAAEIRARLTQIPATTIVTPIILAAAAISATAATIVPSLGLIHASVPIARLISVKPGAFLLPAFACGGRGLEDRCSREIHDDY
jgi:hypothetical protein